jgi:HAD superfamily hydrolase (TIGR01662 family)
VHPVGPAPASISVTKQAGNADDVLMRRLHGRRWRERAGVPRGRRGRHLATVAAGLGAVVAALPRPVFGGSSALPRSPRSRLAALSLGGAWLMGTGELAWARIAPGPRTRHEVIKMLWTSVAIPFAATGWWLRGLADRRSRPRLAAVLFDRDGTLIADVPYNGDPGRVEAMPGAREALQRLREAGIHTAVVSNQSGIARGLLGHEDVAAIHSRMETLLGPLGPLEYCPHGPDDGCECRKPRAGLLLRAAARLGVDPSQCAVIGDIGSDIEAAAAVGARAVLVPTPVTRREEITAAPATARTLSEAVDLLLAP